MNHPDRFLRLLSAAQRSTVKTIDRIEKIQPFLDRLTYCDDNQYHCPLTVLKTNIGCCFEGALFAAAIMQRLGHAPLILDLKACRDDDHVIAVYKRNGLWGAVAKSTFVGLRARQPVYRTLRELVMSYFEFYFDDKRERSLRSFSPPMDLSRLDGLEWMTSDDNLGDIADHLDNMHHIPLLPARTAKSLPPLDRWTFTATGKPRSGGK